MVRLNAAHAFGHAFGRRKREARTHHREWLLAGLHLRLHRAFWTATLRVVQDVVYSDDLEPSVRLDLRQKRVERARAGKRVASGQ